MFPQNYHFDMEIDEIQAIIISSVFEERCIRTFKVLLLFWTKLARREMLKEV